MPDREAVYQLEIRATFCGPVPRDFNKAAPEIDPTQTLCVQAVHDILTRSGFRVASTGHGGKRLDKNGAPE